MRSILDQRLDIVETTLETLRVAAREESGARRQVADDVALARTELRQMIAEETQALRHLIKSGRARHIHRLVNVVNSWFHQRSPNQ